MDWVTIAGYIASVLVGITFTMKTMIPLRMVAIASNVAFIIYGLGGQLWPVLILHTFLFPLNIYRLYQMKTLVNKVGEAQKGEYDFAWLVPFMSKEKVEDGQTLFEEGEDATKMYYISSGGIHLPEYDKTVSAGNIIGEMGIFSSDAKRTAKAVIKGETELYSITRAKMMQLYYQEPKFGFYLIQLLMQRCEENIESKEQN